MSDKELLYGAATTSNQVKFAFGNGNEKFAVAAGQSEGVLSFVAGEKGGAVYVGSSLVSSRVLAYELTGNAGEEQTVTVTYLKSDNTVDTAVCKVVDASFVESQISALEQAVDSSLADIIDSIEDIEAGAKSYSVSALSAEEIAALSDGNNVKEAYKLMETVGEVSTQAGATIKIYKDSALKSVELTDADDKGTAGQFLKFTYLTSTGAESVIYLNVSTFLVQSEFKNGLSVNEAGEVSVKIDATSEGFLTVGEGGVKLSGVQDAIDAATTEIAAKTDGHVTVSSSTGEDGQTIYTISESDIASAEDLADVSTKVDANEAAIATLNGDANTAGSVAKAVADSASALQANIDKKVDASVFEDTVDALEAADASVLADAKAHADGLKQTIDAYTVNGQTISTGVVLDAEDIEYKAAVEGVSEAVSVAGAISALETAIGEGGSVEAQIQAAIEGLDSSATGSGAFVDVEVVMTDGKVTSVSVTEENIASAALLGEATDASNAETAFGKIAKAQATADSAQNDLNALESVVGTKEEGSAIDASTVWGALEEVAETAGADSSKIEAHLNSDFITATAGQAVSVTPTAVEGDYKEFAVALNIASDEKVLSQTADGLKSTISLVHDSSAQTIKLTGINDEVLASIDTTEFVVDGLLEDASYNQTTGILTLDFNDEKSIEINMVELMDIEDIVIANDSSNYLSSSVTADTSVATIGVKLGDFASENQVNGLASTSAVKIYVDAQVAATNTALNDYITSNDSSIANINSELDLVDASIDDLQSAVESIETNYVKVADYNAKTAEIDSSINDLQSAVESIETNYVKVADYSAKTAEIDSSIDALQGNITALQDKDDEIDSSITALLAKDVELDSSINALQDKDEELDSSITAIEAAQSVQDTSINNALTALTWTVL